MAIQCPKCNAENPDTQRFCGECGTQITPDKEVFLTKTLEIPIEELTTGSTFAGRYQIIEELGRGGMGRVYRAKDTKLNEEVALKLIKPEIASSKKTIERFSNELRLFRVHDEAMRCFDKVLELDPKFMPVYEAAIFNSIYSSNPEKAWEYCERYKSALPGNPAPIITTAWVNLISGKLDEALLKSEEALERDPDSSWAYWALGTFYPYKEDYIEAMTWIDKFIASTPPGINSQGYIVKAFIHYLQGRIVLCESFLDKAEQTAEEAKDHDAIYLIYQVNC